MIFYWTKIVHKSGKQLINWAPNSIFYLIQKKYLQLKIFWTYENINVNNETNIANYSSTLKPVIQKCSSLIKLKMLKKKKKNSWRWFTCTKKLCTYWLELTLCVYKKKKQNEISLLMNHSKDTFINNNSA